MEANFFVFVGRAQSTHEWRESENLRRQRLKPILRQPWVLGKERGDPWMG